MSTPTPPNGSPEGEAHIPFNPEHFLDERQRPILVVINDIRELAKSGEKETYEDQDKKGRRKAIQDDAAPILTELVRTQKPRHIFEAGTAYGFSGLYMALGAPDAHMTTVEWDPDVAAKAQSHFDAAGLTDFKVYDGNAIDVIKKLDIPVDMVFLDHEKTQYGADLRALIEGGHLANGALIVADNVNDRRKECQDLVDLVVGSPEFINVDVLPTNAGLLVATYQPS